MDFWSTTEFCLVVTIDQKKNYEITKENCNWLVGHICTIRLEIFLYGNVIPLKL